MSKSTAVIGVTFDELCARLGFSTQLWREALTEEKRFTLLAQIKCGYHVRSLGGYWCMQEEDKAGLTAGSLTSLLPQRRNGGLRDVCSQHTHDFCVNELSGGLTVWRPYGLPQQHYSRSVNSWLCLCRTIPRHCNLTNVPDSSHLLSHSKQSATDWHLNSWHKHSQHSNIGSLFFHVDSGLIIITLFCLLKVQISTLTGGIYCTHSL